MSERDERAIEPVEWAMLVDPAWRPSPKEPEAPIDKIMGVWPIDAHGVRQRFRPNPAYLPFDPERVLDPVDGVLRLLAEGKEVAEYLPEVLADVLLDIAVDGEGTAVVVPAPDGVPSVVVATAPGHRLRVDVPGWKSVSTVELAEALPERGVDVLLNPGSATSMRVDSDVIRRSASSRR